MGKTTQTLDRGRLEKKVLWTEESKFGVFGSQRRTFVRCRKNEKMLEECLTPSVNHRGGNVMVWGCFGGGKVGDLYRVNGILKKEGYHSILQPHSLWTVLNFMPITSYNRTKTQSTAPNYGRTI